MPKQFVPSLHIQCLFPLYQTDNTLTEMLHSPPSRNVLWWEVFQRGSQKTSSIRDLKIGVGVAKWPVYFLPSVAIFTLSFSFQSDVSRTRVKWIMLKIDWHHLLQQRVEKGRQNLNKFLFHGTKEHDNFQEWSLTPVVRSVIQTMQA